MGSRGVIQDLESPTIRICCLWKEKRATLIKVIYCLNQGRGKSRTGEAFRGMEGRGEVPSLEGTRDLGGGGLVGVGVRRGIALNEFGLGGGCREATAATFQ